MKVLKFGGKSLANGEGIDQVISIIAKKYFDGETISVVVSARGNATDELLDILDNAKRGNDYTEALAEFKEYQTNATAAVLFESEFSTLEKLFEGVRLLGDYSEKIKDQVVSFGEILSAKYVTSVLNEK
jgi:aspartokinase/homoserine dehydrogenase 1